MTFHFLTEPEISGQPASQRFRAGQDRRVRRQCFVRSVDFIAQEKTTELPLLQLSVGVRNVRLFG